MECCYQCSKSATAVIDEGTNHNDKKTKEKTLMTTRQPAHKQERKLKLDEKAMHGRKRISVLVKTVFCFLILISPFTISAREISVKAKFQNGDFKLAYKNLTADILISENDFKVAQIAAGDFASDVERVSGKKPQIKNQPLNLSGNIVIIGTLGKSQIIEDLVKSGKINVTQIKNKWESFLFVTIENPFPNVENALVIVGSDRRGTAFGVYEMSQTIGVSPWIWWADVAPERRESLIISKGIKIGGEPSVKYRGIFLNDEDWGLQPWAAKTFEPETGSIGPKTYAKIFELLLRLKANTCWSAMHEVTKPFNFIPENKRVADDYAIVMGSSHAEPMLRNNVGEWKDDKGKYNFVSNETGVTKYWEDRIKENGKYENIYTLGMRGIHDSPIQGTKTQAERIPVLEKIIATQRNLLAKYIDVTVEKIPQIFCPYKEVLADYRTGLKVPDDVTIVFPDDNFGYIRAFPNAEEQKRLGGFGVYYHISYLGRPLSYLWLETTPPALVWEEMSKAFANGIREFWMLNVGDIKPAEIGIEFFMQMSYDKQKWRRDNLNDYLKTWAKREFGAKNSIEIAQIMDGYYRLGFQRKPEHLQWFLPKETARKSDFSEVETLERLEDYANLRRRAETIYKQISPLKKDAFYELVLYPVRSATLANERFFAAELALIYKQQNRNDALDWARKSIAADAEIESETRYFNETLASGKWRFMMSPEMNAGQWTSMRSTPPKLAEADFQAANSKNKPVSETENRPHSPRVSPSKSRKNTKVFAESNGVISMEAENFTRKNDANGFAWEIIQGLGKTGDSVSIFPQTAKTFANFSGDAPHLEYQFQASDAGEYQANFFLIPTQPLVAGNGLRLAFSIDGEPVQVIVIDRDTDVSSPKWAQNVLNSTTVGTNKINLSAGAHVLKIYAVDTGVVLDKIVINTGGMRPGYFAPPETLIR